MANKRGGGRYGGPTADRQGRGAAKPRLRLCSASFYLAKRLWGGGGGLGSVTVLYRLQKVLCDPHGIDEIGLRFLLFRIVGVLL